MAGENKGWLDSFGEWLEPLSLMGIRQSMETIIKAIPVIRKGLTDLDRRLTDGWSNISDKTKKWLESRSEITEQEISNAFSWLKDYGVPQSGIDALVGGVMAYTPPVPILTDIFRLIILWKNTGVLYDSSWQVIQNALAQAFNRQAPITLPTRGELIQLQFRTPDDSGINDLIKRSGYNDENWQRLLTANRPILGVNEALTLLNRANLGYGPELTRDVIYTKAEEIFERLGYSQYDISFLQMLRHSMPDLTTLLELARRDKTIDRKLPEYLEALGYDSLIAQCLPELRVRLPSPADIVRFGVREVFTPEIMEKFGQGQDFPDTILDLAGKAGISEEYMRMYWAAHWDLPAPGQGFEMFHRGLITYDELKMLLRALDVMPFWRDRLIGLSYELIPRRTLRMISVRGLMTKEESLARYKLLGYNDADSALMVETDFWEDTAEERELTKGEILAAFRRNLITYDMAFDMLKELEYSDKAITFILRYNEYVRQLDASTSGSKVISPLADGARDLTKAEILKAYTEGLLTIAETRNRLLALGYGPTEYNLLIATEDYKQLREQKERLAAEYRERFLNGTTNRLTATDSLRKIGYTAAYAEQLASVWAEELETKNQLAAKRDKLPTLATINKWVKLGVITVEQWAGYMAKQGYNDSEIENYLYELLLEQEA